MTWTRRELGRRSDQQVAEISDRVLNRVMKWRGVFAGWQLGTRTSGDPESQAVRDQRELLMLVRIELNALTACLIESGAITSRSFTEQVIVEAELLDKAYEDRFPGMRSTDAGMELFDLQKAQQTMAGWRP